MADQDQIIGGIMTVVGIVGILLEAFFLIIQPLADPSRLANMPRVQFWAMAIPLFLAVAGVLAIVTWIGVTMIRTPPPEVMDFEDFEEADIDKATEEETKKEPAKKTKKATKTSSGGDLDLTEIRGIGASTADDLKAAGYTTVSQIANATIEELTEIKGVGKASAKKYINNAKELL